MTGAGTTGTGITAPGRHYGIDWLRIGAFALLILYHAAMVFSPWGWVVKWPHLDGWLIAPLAITTPWRLPLIFVVSGYATRRLIERRGTIGDFARVRTVRLLAPLAFALVALLPPEMWVRARGGGYPAGLARFWLIDGWQPFPAGRLGFPAWEHLWFLVYLWAYTMLLAAAVRWRGAAAIQAGAERLLAGRRLLWVPLAALGAARLALMFVFPETHRLIGDWVGHALYLPMFTFGVVLGGSPPLWAAVRRRGAAPAIVAVLAGVVVLVVEERWPGTEVPPHAVAALDRLAQVAMGWSVVLVLLRLADAHANRDGRWRAALGRAVFPAYIVHHPVIVVTAAALIPTGIGAPAAFAVILVVTLLACAAAAAAAREVRWLAPLLGGAPREAGPAPAARAAESPAR